MNPKWAQAAGSESQDEPAPACESRHPATSHEPRDIQRGVPALVGRAEELGVEHVQLQGLGHGHGVALDHAVPKVLAVVRVNGKGAEVELEHPHVSIGLGGVARVPERPHDRVPDAFAVGGRHLEVEELVRHSLFKQVNNAEIVVVEGSEEVVVQVVDVAVLQHGEQDKAVEDDSHFLAAGVALVRRVHAEPAHGVAGLQFLHHRLLEFRWVGVPVGEGGEVLLDDGLVDSVPHGGMTQARVQHLGVALYALVDEVDDFLAVGDIGHRAQVAVEIRLERGGRGLLHADV
ncbi:dihydropteroate synthase [Babesia caballi]|uniref:Dihydropteroate synthase n=1 Tax=Babesia caballi TaxID=5871 RepID=A0AAV4LMZ0_BABCB|nr:dihydropteroate synthase [Babesia caballi]